MMPSTWSSTPAKVQLERLKKFDKAMTLFMPNSFRLNEWFSAATFLYDDFIDTGDASSLDAAISTLNQIIVWQSGDKPYADASQVLSKLGTALQSRFSLNKNLDDIIDSIKWQREAIKTNKGREYSPLNRQLDELSVALRLRYEDSRSNNPADLNDSIAQLRECIRVSSPTEVYYTLFLDHLAASLILRFSNRGSLEDQDEAVRLYQSAVDLTPENSPELHICIGNLAAALDERYVQQSSSDDLEKIVALYRRATQVARTRYDKSQFPVCVSNLGGALQLRFQADKRPEDAYEAEAAYRESIALSLPEDSRLPTRHYLLATLLLALYNTAPPSHSLQLDQAIDHLGKAVELIPPHHPIRVTYSLKLALALESRFHTGHQPSLPAALGAFQWAAITSHGPVSDRYVAAVWWGHLAGLRKQIESSLRGFTLAMQLLPRVVSLDQINEVRQATLSTHALEFACDAAAMAIEAQKLDVAVELFEQGRAVFWQQALQLRTNLDELRAIDSDLCDELSHTAKGLEAAAHGSNPMPPPFKDESNRALQKSVASATRPLSDMRDDPEVIALRHRRLAERWDQLIEMVRKVRGFEHFLAPLPFSELHNASLHGPVILVNISMHRCDALILEAGHGGREDIKHVRLHKMSHRLAREISQQLGTALTENKAVRRDDRHMVQVRPANASSPDRLENILATLWKTIVHPIADALGLTKQSIENLPHLWWCISGPLAAAPFHAAGIYRKDGLCLHDLAISSYTPNLKTLLTHISKASESHEYFQAMAVSQPDTPGQRPLPNTTEEAKSLRKILPGGTLQILEGRLATVENVVASLKTSNWAHWACHGVQQPGKPLESGLMLEDGCLLLSRLMEFPLPRAEFAFLSACQTATGDNDVPNESMHLAGGMLFAGFHSVIATLWSIRDCDGPVVTKAVYSKMCKDGEPDSSQAAMALHSAISVLRTAGVPFVRWVPFIHIGI